MRRAPVVLVTGAAGQVGRALAGLLPTARFLDHSKLDVTDRDAVRDAVHGARAIIHLGAMTHVDDCETVSQECFRINALGTRNVAEAAGAHTRVIYLSTDYVFDGKKRREYVEEDPPNPINAYGRSKLEGEGHVSSYPGNLIVRSSWIFGEGRNFVRTILGAARAKRSLKVVSDQWGRPTFAGDLAAALVHLLDAEEVGLIHVAGDGRPCSWADLAEQAISFDSLPTPVVRVSSQEYSEETGVSTPRPRNSVLSVDRARMKGVPLSDWKSSLQDYVRGL